MPACLRICLLLAFTLTACNSSYLSVHTDYLSHENLASYHVGTPDPRLNNPPVGQRLIISWSIPKMFLKNYEEIVLDVTIRFRNRDEAHERFLVPKRRGTYIYSLLNEDYYSKRGILSYKIDLVADGSVIEEWRHQIWADLITITHEKQPTDSGNVQEESNSLEDLENLDL